AGADRRGAGGFRRLCRRLVPGSPRGQLRAAAVHGHGGDRHLLAGGKAVLPAPAPARRRRPGIACRGSPRPTGCAGLHPGGRHRVVPRPPEAADAALVAGLDRRTFSGHPGRVRVALVPVRAFQDPVRVDDPHAVGWRPDPGEQV
ncbi:MAG: Signal peptidase I, partial [uncultured Ramlibacter sp.]